MRADVHANDVIPVIPIPMRGSEEVAFEGAPVFAGEIPIPMRGSESAAAEGSSTVAVARSRSP